MRYLCNPFPLFTPLIICYVFTLCNSTFQLTNWYSDRQNVELNCFNVLQVNIELIILKNCEEFLYSDRYQYHVAAFSLVIVHDFLDHVDGIVAKAHRQMFGQIDDPLLGGFMDAFCDKVITL